MAYNYTTYSYNTGTGPTYEQEVQSFLDQTSPYRIREQTQTTLPPASYMDRAAHESVTNENSPARTGRATTYQTYDTYYQPAYTPTYTTTTYSNYAGSPYSARTGYYY